MSEKTDKSSWAVGGGAVLGVGIGFFFLHVSPLYFVGAILCGVGLGLIVSAVLSRCQ